MLEKKKLDCISRNFILILERKLVDEMKAKGLAFLFISRKSNFFPNGNCGQGTHPECPFCRFLVCFYASKPDRHCCKTRLFYLSTVYIRHFLATSEQRNISPHPTLFVFLDSSLASFYRCCLRRSKYTFSFLTCIFGTKS